MAGSVWVKVFPAADEPAWSVLSVEQAGYSIHASWPAADGAVAYEVSVDGTVTNVGDVTSWTSPEVVPTEQHEVKVRGISASGSKGAWSAAVACDMEPFNRATGGTVTTIENYNDSGETWNVHTFTASSEPLNVEVAALPFRVLVVGGGNGGGGTAHSGNGGPQGDAPGGSGGKYHAIDAHVLTKGQHAVAVGGGGAHSSLGTLSTETGTPGGGGGRGYTLYNVGDPGGVGVKSNITGALVGYAGGGGGGGGCEFKDGGPGTDGGGNGGRGNNFDNSDGDRNAQNGKPARANSGGGGGGGGSCGDRNFNWNLPGGAGGAGAAGIVIVAYRVA